MAGPANIRDRLSSLVESARETTSNLVRCSRKQLHVRRAQRRALMHEEIQLQSGIGGTMPVHGVSSGAPACLRGRLLGFEVRDDADELEHALPRLPSTLRAAVEFLMVRRDARRPPRPVRQQDLVSRGDFRL